MTSALAKLHVNRYSLLYTVDSKCLGKASSRVRQMAHDHTCNMCYVSTVEAGQSFTIASQVAAELGGVSISSREG